MFNNITYLSNKQKEVLNESVNYKESEQVKEIWKTWFGAVFIETKGSRYFTIDRDGTISEKTYHDLFLFDNEKPLYIN